MARIRKRGKFYACEVRKKGHDPVRKSGFRTKKEARDWATEQESKINKGTTVDTSKLTLAELITDYRDGRSLNTYENKVLDWWVGELGTQRVAVLRRKHFIRARKKLKALPGRTGDPISVATVNRRMAAISAVLSWHLDDHEEPVIEINPARMKSLTEEVPHVEPLTDKQRKRLLKACAESDQPALLPFTLCAMVSGARAGELQGLRWKDVNLKKGIARLFDTKNGTNRVIPIQGRALEALKEYQGDTPHIGNSFVFRNNTGTFPFNYRKSWGIARDTAGMDLRFHDLRHDAASNLAMAGISLREIGEVLGHKSAQMSQRYSHFVEDHIAELGGKLADKID